MKEFKTKQLNNMEKEANKQTCRDLLENLREVIKSKLIVGDFTIVSVFTDFGTTVYQLDVDGLIVNIPITRNGNLSNNSFRDELLPNISVEEFKIVLPFIQKLGLKMAIKSKMEEIENVKKELDSLILLQKSQTVE